ncbi:MAG: hypothetical protein AAB588_00145 [Patescibacteria group bacterium]
MHKIYFFLSIFFAANIVTAPLWLWENAPASASIGIAIISAGFAIACGLLNKK